MNRDSDWMITKHRTPHKLLSTYFAHIWKWFLILSTRFIFLCPVHFKNEAQKVGKEKKKMKGFFRRKSSAQILMLKVTCQPRPSLRILREQLRRARTKKMRTVCIPRNSRAHFFGRFDFLLARTRNLEWDNFIFFLFLLKFSQS